MQSLLSCHLELGNLKKSLCAFYASGSMTPNGFTGTRKVDGKDVSYTISDGAEVLEFFAK